MSDLEVEKVIDPSSRASEARPGNQEDGENQEVEEDNQEELLRQAAMNLGSTVDDDVISVDDEDGSFGDDLSRKERRLIEKAELKEWLVDGIEAVILCSREPVSVGKARELVRQESGHRPPVAEVRLAMKELLDRWNAEERSFGRGFHLVSVGGGLAFRTSPEQAPYLQRMFAQKPQRLSRAALEALSIVAYRQPVTRPQVDDIRGVDCSGSLKALLDKGLVRILGKADDVGRPLLYGTTKTFLEFFNLASLRDLPTLADFRELDPEQNALFEELNDGEKAAVIMDLYNPETDKPIVSAETKVESDDALEELESALADATEVVERVAPNKGKTSEKTEAEAKPKAEATSPDEATTDTNELGSAAESEANDEVAQSAEA